MIIPIYKQNGQPIEFSDDGQGVKNIEGGINYQLFAKKLSTRQLRALELKIDGHSLSEIARIMKISEATLWRDFKKMKGLAKNML